MCAFAGGVTPTTCNLGSPWGWRVIRRRLPRFQLLSGPIGSVRLLRKSVESFADQSPDIRKEIFDACIDATLRRRCGSRDAVTRKMSDEELITLDCRRREDNVPRFHLLGAGWKGRIF